MRDTKKPTAQTASVGGTTGLLSDTLIHAQDKTRRNSLQT